MLFPRSLASFIQAWGNYAKVVLWLQRYSFSLRQFFGLFYSAGSCTFGQVSMPRAIARPILFKRILSADPAEDHAVFKSDLLVGFKVHWPVRDFVYLSRVPARTAARATKYTTARFAASTIIPIERTISSMSSSVVPIPNSAIFRFVNSD